MILQDYITEMVFRLTSFIDIKITICPPLRSRRLHARLSRSGPGFDPRSGQVSCVRFYRVFSSPVKQTSGNFRPTRSPNIIWPSSVHIHLVRINGCVNDCVSFSCSCCLEVVPALSWSLIRGGPPCPCVFEKVAYVYDPKLIPSPDRSRLWEARMMWVT